MFREEQVLPHLQGFRLLTSHQSTGSQFFLSSFGLNFQKPELFYEEEACQIDLPKSTRGKIRGHDSYLVIAAEEHHHGPDSGYDRHHRNTGKPAPHGVLRTLKRLEEASALKDQWSSS